MKKVEKEEGILHIIHLVEDWKIEHNGPFVAINSKVLLPFRRSYTPVPSTLSRRVDESAGGIFPVFLYIYGAKQ